MFKNFITLAYRHFVRTPLTSFIEVFGLTAAFTVSILVLLWAHHELSYDKFNEHYERIYRVEGGATNSPLHARLSFPEIQLYQNEISGIESLAWFAYRNEETLSRVDKENSKAYFNSNFIYASQSFFEVFSLKFVNGNPLTALKNSNQVVLTETLAITMFGSTDVLGKIITDGSGEESIVTGVIRDTPNFHIKFEALFSTETMLKKSHKDRLNNWASVWFNGFVLLPVNQDIRSIEKQMSRLYNDHAPEEQIEKFPDPYTVLRPIEDVYFNAKDISSNGYSKHGDFYQILAFGSATVFCLFLSCLNFVRLRGAKSLGRIKEITIKKVTGATKESIFMQLLGEVGLVLLISMALAIIFSHSLLGYFNSLMGSTASYERLISLEVLSLLAISFIIICLLAGGIPALYVSSFRPVEALRGITVHNNRTGMRQIGLIVQFSITMLLLIGITTIIYQLKHMKDSDTGIDLNEVVTFEIGLGSDELKAEFLKKSLQTHPNVHSASLSWNGAPGDEMLILKGGSTVNFEGADHKMIISGIDEDYGDLLDLEVLEGRIFDPNGPNDKFDHQKAPNTINVVLNETAASLLGKDDLINMIGKIVWNNQKFRIVGVVKDFHLNAANSKIPPMLFVCVNSTSYLLAKISSKDIPETIRFIEKETERITNKKPDIQFVEDRFRGQYTKDENFAALIMYLTLLIVIISSMGLLGIFIQTIKARIKEVGIRKVMGASLIQILRLLSGSIFKTIVIATVIAIPVGNIVMNNWLANYPYRIEMDWTIYAIAIGATLAIAAITIGWQCWRASNTNPSRLIRYE